MKESLRVIWLKNRGAKIEKKTRGLEWMREVGPRGEVTVSEAAALLGVTPVTVLRWLSAGSLKVVSKGRQATVRLDDLRREAVERGLFVGVEG